MDALGVDGVELRGGEVDVPFVPVSRLPAARTTMTNKAIVDKKCLRIFVSNQREEETANVKSHIVPVKCARNNPKSLSDFSADGKSDKNEDPCMKPPPNEQHPTGASKNPATIGK